MALQPSVYAVRKTTACRDDAAKLAYRPKEPGILQLVDFDVSGPEAAWWTSPNPSNDRSLDLPCQFIKSCSSQLRNFRGNIPRPRTVGRPAAAERRQLLEFRPNRVALPLQPIVASRLAMA